MTYRVLWGTLLGAAGASGAALALGACGSTSSASPGIRNLTAEVAAAVANPVAVSPLPGTADASPATQISFLGAAGTHVSNVRAVGSRSGVHTGVLRAYATGTGESFLPGRPFEQGERVSVRATVTSGSTTAVAHTSFTIARQAAISEKEFPINKGNPNAVQHYLTEPAFKPSTVTITKPAQPGTSPGYLFLAPYQGEGTAGPMIVDQGGGLVWFHPLPASEQAANFGVAQYEGRPVLAWWQGRILEVGFGQGEDVLYDSSYRRIATIRAGNGYHADLHVLKLTSEGTAWIDAFDPVHMNLSAWHGAGAEGVLNDSVVQEIDIKTGLVMWEWHALGHIPLSESQNPPQTNSYPWDYTHVNAVVPGSSGDVLLSSRNMWALYDVDIHSGGTRWQLGGVNSSFRLGPGVRFYWQHDAEWQPGGMISLFDNGSDPRKERQSRGLLLAPDASSHTVKLVKAYVNPSRTLLAESQGNLQALPGGNWLLGYGRLPNFTELDPSGRVLLDGTLGHEVQSFKTELYPWEGQPLTPPALVASRSGPSVSVVVSWNGATQVASWRVLAGPSPTSLAPVASAAKAGFETKLSVATAASYVAVQALDGSGAVLATSAAAPA